MEPGPTSLVASLIAHTNVGKTTLARTLLGRDVGEVRDAAHVTEWVDEHLWLEAEGGTTLLLADTPGFGDSVRLARRMQQADQPLGWLLSAVWDRWRDRAFWSSQQALRHVRERSDVMLFLVDAGEAPRVEGTLAAELQLLAWVGKPTLVLLNQLGPPREPALEAAQLQAWRDALAPHATIKAVLPLDAFARCWVQEATLLRALADVLPAQHRTAMQALIGGWQQRSQTRFDAAMAVLADGLAQAAGAKVEIDDEGSWRDRLAAFTGLAAGDSGPEARARAALLAVADAADRHATTELLRLHGLDGQAEGEITQRVRAQVALHRRVDEGRAALLGGALSGAVVGLKADLMSGGLTLGGGLLAGSILGALGAAGLARGVNVVRGTGRSWVGWPAAALPAMAEVALLRYLAVAHFGRGRGEWSEGEAPAHWQAVVQAALQQRADDWQLAWKQPTAAALRPLLAAAARHALEALYPDATNTVPKPPAT